ncbi:nuclear transport factor 2 family protein [Danxiaibacter flavus]|uniref:Nuclear transport factor 2 family protein n=1 Tax=Danxiaibacter flavus TaxID=3049108 RepID=A0ABV3ZEE2_9BACT|nr:nuclear transport factor 2 family protein [Chitinophagaceae bacterium DXS]
MKTILASVILVILSSQLYAQTQEDSVKAVINKFFAAMKDADAAGMQACFADSALLQTVVNKNGKVSVRTEAIKEFVASVSKLTKGDADERITFETVKSDGSLAIAWTPYNFFYKGQFSHCGTNSFQVVNINGQWKIQYIIDTRKKVGCAEAK